MNGKGGEVIGSKFLKITFLLRQCHFLDPRLHQGAPAWVQLRADSAEGVFSFLRIDHTGIAARILCGCTLILLGTLMAREQGWPPAQPPHPRQRVPQPPQAEAVSASSCSPAPMDL